MTRTIRFLQDGHDYAYPMPPDRPAEITARQWEAMTLRADGATYARIAAQLGISGERARQLIVGPVRNALRHGQGGTQ